MSRRRVGRDPLLVELVAAIGAGRSEIRPLHYDKAFLHGLCEGSRVYINPSVSVVDTALHECLHRMRPAWSERAVRAKITRLMALLSLEEVDRIYEIVLATAKHRKTPKKV
jgi:hypothetical protein